MPFQYTPYRNQYVGSITDLMGRGRDAEAQALIDSAHAQAQAAQVSGRRGAGRSRALGIPSRRFRGRSRRSRTVTVSWRNASGQTRPGR